MADPVNGSIFVVGNIDHMENYNPDLVHGIVRRLLENSTYNTHYSQSYGTSYAKEDMEGQNMQPFIKVFRYPGVSFIGNMAEGRPDILVGKDLPLVIRVEGENPSDVFDVELAERVRRTTTNLYEKLKEKEREVISEVGKSLDILFDHGGVLLTPKKFNGLITKHELARI